MEVELEVELRPTALAAPLSDEELVWRIRAGEYALFGATGVAWRSLS